MQYQEICHILPQEIYMAHLETINSIKMSKREIDIISCVLNGRSSKGIGHFLSISPRTVEAHTRNAMKKLGCTSRESLISLIENTDHFLTLKDYYLKLLAYVAFEKSLKAITRLAAKEIVGSCLIVYWHEENRVFFNSLKTHLTLIGIPIVLEEREQGQPLAKLVQEDPHDTYTIYAVSSLSGESKKITPQDSKKAKPLSENPSQNSGKILFLLLDDKEYQPIPQEIGSYAYISIAEQKNYYFFVFSVIKQILLNLDLEKIIEEFEKRHDMLLGSDNSVPAEVYLELEEAKTQKGGSPPRFKEKKITDLIHNRYLTAFFLMMTLTAGSFFFLHKQNNDNAQSFQADQANTVHSSHHHQKQLHKSSTRSDLLIPAEPLLLKRLEIIRRIDDQFKKQQNGIQTVVLLGIGGAGKTTLAREYARFQNAPIIWEINADTQSSLMDSFENLVYALSQTEEEKKIWKELKGIENPKEKEEKTLHFLKGQLKIHPNWLLIFDNVEKFSGIEKYFPSDSEVWGKGRIILTTRNENIQSNHSLPHAILVGELMPEEKLNLFTKILKGENTAPLTAAQKEQTNQFLKEISSFPLDVSIAAYYLKVTNISYSKYIEILNRYKKDFDHVQVNILKEIGNYTKTRYGIITLSLKEIITESQDFVDLFLFISLLDTQNIPRDLLEQYKDTVVVDNFIYHLKKYSLITSKSLSSSSLLCIHGSTQDIALSYLTQQLNLERDNQLLKTILNTLDDYLNHAIEIEDLPKMQVMAVHLEKLLDNRNLLSHLSQGLLESKLGCVYYFINDGKAHQKIENSIKVLATESSKNISSDDSSRIARSFLQAGNICTELRHYQEAQASIERAIHIYRKNGLKNNIELSWALSHLGNVYRRIGNYEKAKEHLEESIQLTKGNNVDSRRMARTLSYLGSVYMGLGFYGKSIETLEKSLISYKKHYSDDHFRIGWVLIQLGNVYRKLGDYHRAKEYLENGSTIFKQYFPENHMNIGLVLAYLGNCYRELGDHEKSMEYLEKSLKIHQKHFDENHLRMGWVLFHLANAYKALDRNKDSQALFDKVLDIYKKNSEGENVETARYLRNMAEIYLEKDQLEHAEDLLQRSLKILQDHNHLEAYMSLEILAEIYFIKSSHTKIRQQSHNLKNQAINYLNQALGIIKVHFPSDSLHLQRINTKLIDIQK